MAGCSNPGVALCLSTTDPEGGRNEGVWGRHLFIKVDEGTLSKGDTVWVDYGRGDGGGLTNAGARARYYEGPAEFTVAVDPDGSRSAPAGGFYLIAGEQPSIQVVPGPPSHLHVTSPSIAGREDEVAVQISARDRQGNSVKDLIADLSISAGDGNAVITPMANGRAETRIRVPAAEGVVRVRCETADGVLSGQSNPCRIADVTEGSPYWGDIHVMTGISAGLGRPSEALEYARDDALLDFCAVTDGDDADGYYSDAEWDETKAAVRSYHDPGRFVTLLASEYHERRAAGDKNIYYRSDDVPLLRWSDLPGEQPGVLWKALSGRRALTVPHHVCSGSARLSPWEHHDAEFQRLVEIYSVWGSSEAGGELRPNFWRHNPTNSVRSALAKGYRLGIVASGDSHDGHPGNSEWLRVRRGYRGGLVAVFAPELTREAVFDALWDRACYGTTGARILMDVRLSGAQMGQELTSSSDRERRLVEVDVQATAPIRDVTIVRNGEEVHSVKGTGEGAAFDWGDTSDFGRTALKGFDGRPFIYYYVRVTQVDGEMAWSSPTWVSTQEALD